jgi:VWFA-related protein
MAGGETPMTRSGRRLTTLLLALLAAPFAAGAQEAPVELESFADLVEVTEVSLDVLATDGDGQPVPGLGMADFEVLEDGVPVELTGVSFASNSYEGSGIAGEIPASRYLIFFFHDQSAFAAAGHHLLHAQMQAGRDALRWVEEKMAPSDWAAVVGYDIELQLHQDFTQDRDALKRALERVAAGKKPEEFLPSRREARGRGRELEILSRMAPRPQSPKNVYEGLRQVAEASGYLVGRKILLLYTVGFGERRGHTSIPDPRYFPDLEIELNDHNVAIYPLDLSPAGRPPIEEDFLNLLAATSGGSYDPNIVGFYRPLLTITEANTGYYLLTYRSARKAGEIGYQRVEVRAKGPNVRLLARRGYRYGL